MLGLDQDLIEYELSIKSGFWPYMQPPRRMLNDVKKLVQDKIKQLADASSIEKV